LTAADPFGIFTAPMLLSLPERPMSDRERTAAVALARAILPSTEAIAGADAETVRLTEGFISRMLPELVGPWGAAQRALAASARLFTGKPLEALSDSEAEQLVAQWSEHPLMGKVVNAVAAVYKITHFDRPDLRGALRHKLGVIENIEQPRWLEQTTRAEEFEESDLECDVVVIGTGAGGAVVGRHLAEQGHAVVFIEEGEHRRRNDFPGNFLWALEHLYRNIITVGNAPIAMPQGRLVGGSTAVNGGSSFRPPRWVTDRWCEELGSDEFSSDALSPYFDRTESILQVGEADTRFMGPIHDIFERGCVANGWHHAVMRRNAPGCEGSGFCDNGCRTDARRSTNLSYLPPALERGAFMLSGLRADKLLIEGGRAVGIEGVALTRDRSEVVDRTGKPKKIRVRGKAVILAGGSIASPLFLLSQGLANSSDQVGRNLTVHPSGPVTGMFDEVVDGGRYIPQADYSHEFLKEGLMLLTASPDPHVAPPLLPFVGRRLMDILSRTAHIGGVGYLVTDDARGRIRIGPNGRALLTYNLSKLDVERCHRGLALCVELLLAAGATEVFPGMLTPHTIRDRAGLERFRALNVKASELLLTSYHPLGSCRMSASPKDGVVDLNHQSHDVPGLFIVDGSTVRGPLGVNPQITIMGLATRAADKIGALLD